MVGAIACARRDGDIALSATDLLNLNVIGLHVQDRFAQLEHHVHRNAFESLTPRKIQICQEIAAGRTNKEIAGQLGIGIDAVKWHLKSIFASVCVFSRDELVREFLFWYPTGGLRKK